MVPVSSAAPARPAGSADGTGRRSPKGEGGFSLIEVMVSILVLTVGLLSLVGAMTVGLQSVAGSSATLIAREKAREAVESVHTARDTGELAWNRVQNVADGGDFLDGPQDVREPGADGLVNTDDDGAIEVLVGPGADGLLETEDDTETPLARELFQRQIAITPLTLDGSETVNLNLRQVTVTVRYRVLGAWRTYTLTTYVSAYS
jgi:prepilin-type N-terminal cleavage/methylation domain-containing protein